MLRLCHAVRGDRRASHLEERRNCKKISYFYNHNFLKNIVWVSSV